MSEDIIELSKCYGCRKVYEFSLMKPIILVENQEEGQIKVKRYLCNECNEKFKRLKFIQVTEHKRKEGTKEVIKNVRRKEGRKTS